MEYGQAKGCRGESICFFFFKLITVIALEHSFGPPMPITYTPAILSANGDSLTFGFNPFSSHTVPDKPSGFLL